MLALFSQITIAFNFIEYFWKFGLEFAFIFDRPPVTMSHPFRIQIFFGELFFKNFVKTHHFFLNRHALCNGFALF